MKIRLFIIIVVVLAMVGCVAVSVDRVKGVAELGASYIKTLKQVNDLALDQSIQFTANILPDLQRTEVILDEQSKILKERVKLIGSANQYLDCLANYFAELEALAKGDQSEATEKGLDQIMDSLKQEPAELKISDERKKSLTGLARYVTKQIHAAAVEKALIRDADTVAQSLAVTEQMLNEEIKWLKLRANAEQKTYQDKVVKPFVNNNKLGVDWRKAWSDYVRPPPVMALFTDAKKASKDMQTAWINVLRGEYSYTELQASLKNVKEGLDAVNALKSVK
jgi:hypothetical protein